MTRAQERLLLMTQGDGGEKAASRFVARAARTGRGRSWPSSTGRRPTTWPMPMPMRGAEGDGALDDGARPTTARAPSTPPWPPPAGSCRCPPRASAASRCACGRASSWAWPRPPPPPIPRPKPPARPTPPAWRTWARGAALSADEARAAGLDPLTFRSLALDSGAGANLLAIAPLPPTFSYSSLSTYEACPLRYAFSYVYRIPEPDRPAAHLTFGSTAHSAFEAFTRERRERLARGEPAPTREDLERHFTANWKPAAFGDKTTEATFERRVGRLLDNFWDGEVSSLGEAIAEELDFTLVIETADGTPPVRIYGGIDRIDRLPGGGIEVIDYKTGKISSQKGVDENLQLTIYALACRDALGLGTPERVTLYFTESATRLSTVRTDEQLDLAREELLARVLGRSGRGSSRRPRGDPASGVTIGRCARSGRDGGRGRTYPGRHG